MLAHKYGGRTHDLDQHLQSVAKLCGVGTSYNIGRLHDFGKYRNGFQQYLNGDIVDPKTKTHAVAGARYILDKCKGQSDPTTLYVAMAAITCHHTGLTDDISTRIGNNWSTIEYNESLVGCNTQIELQPWNPVAGDISMQIRMHLSTLVDADWTDTASWYGNHTVYNFDDLTTLRGKLEKLQFTAKNKIDAVRTSIRANCEEKSSCEPGWFTLSVPTGGGKTISGMSFAVNHAIAHNKQRIIVVIPYTSIIDQTHKIYSDIFGSDNVLAHHSNIDPTPQYRQHAQRWEHPIIVTTAVQFLETLMACKNSKLRKLHNVRNSVIILDESQMLPLEMLDVTMRALKSLVDDHGCSIVLSTATQANYKQYGISPTEIIQDIQMLHEVLRRTDITYQPNIDIINSIVSGGSSLTIVNTRKTALMVYNQVAGYCDCVYLSAYMHPHHRRATIQNIKNRLNNGEVVKIISTQLVEAGVDIDLPVVYREIAGIDNIIQSAGRCNRNGNLEVGQVIVFDELSEHLPPSIRRSISHTRKLINQGMNDFDACTRYLASLHKDSNTDAKNIMPLIDNVPPLIKFASIAAKYKIVDDDSFTIICQSKVDIGNMQANQSFSITVYKQDLQKLIKMNAITEVEGLDDVWCLTDDRWYHPTLGVVVD